MRRQIASIEAMEQQGYGQSVVIFSDHPRRLEAVLELLHGNLTMTLRVSTIINGERVVATETTVMRQAIDCYNEL